MNCAKCNGTLIRIKISEMKSMIQNSVFISCDICQGFFFDGFIPIMYCHKCNYTVCPKCTFSSIKKKI